MNTRGTFRFPVERQQVRRFAEAGWDPRSAALAESGELSTLPPTYFDAAATICGRPHSLPMMDFDVARAFHGTEIITLYSSVSISDELEVHESIRHLSDVRGRRGGLMHRALRQSDFFDDNHFLVARVKRIILETEEAPVATRPTSDLTIFDDGLDPRPNPVPTAAVPPNTLQPGTRLMTGSFGPLTRTDFVRYAAASGDLTAVHFDEYAAMSRGYAAPFAMGMLSAVFIGRMVTSWVELVPPWTLTVRFRDQVWPGETLEVAGQVGSVGTTIDVTCSAADRVVTSATLELGRAQ